MLRAPSRSHGAPRSERACLEKVKQKLAVALGQLSGRVSRYARDVRDQRTHIWENKAEDASDGSRKLGVSRRPSRRGVDFTLAILKFDTALLEHSGPTSTPCNHRLKHYRVGEVRVEATDLSTFPDLTVVCGQRQVSNIDKNAVTNPTLLVEVTSSTEDYDRGEKLNHFKQCASLRAVLFVSHRRPQVTLVQRADKDWQEHEFCAGDEVHLIAPAARFTVDDLYRGITLDDSAS